jgi:hypothetical protein
MKWEDFKASSRHCIGRLKKGRKVADRIDGNRFEPDTPEYKEFK